MPERDFRKSLIWKKNRFLMLALFDATEAFPSQGSYALTNQIRHDCLSMVTNIVKGCGNLMPIEMVEFFKKAWRAASDLESHLLSACCHGLLNAANYERFAHEVTTVKGMLAACIK
jgi:four helix bundle protein